MTYDFEVVYKRGKENRATNALSRIPNQGLSCMVLSSVSSDLYQQVLSFCDHDERVQKMLQKLQQNPQSHKNFTYSQGQLKKKGRIVVRNDETVQKTLLKLFHTSGLGDH